MQLMRVARMLLPLPFIIACGDSRVAPGGDTSRSTATTPLVRITFRFAELSPVPGWERATAPYLNRSIYVSNDVVLSNADFDIVDAYAIPDGVNLVLAYNDAGRARVAALTEQNLDRILTVWIDGRLVSAPVIKSRISGTVPHQLVAPVPDSVAARIIETVEQHTRQGNSNTS